MPKHLTIVVNPVDTAVTLRHDDGGGAVWTGVPGVASDGRAAKVITIPDGIPEGHGARLTMTTPRGTVQDPRGRLIWAAGSDVAEFTCDDFTIKDLPFDPRRLPRLVTRGQFFALETGERFTAIQSSDFNLLARWIKEGPAAVDPVLKQRADLGFNMLRVWTHMALSQYGIGDLNPHDYPDFYTRIIPEFAGHCASHGLYVEFTAYTGYPGRDDASHWPALGAAAATCTNVILELVNENDQAGNALPAISIFSPIAGVLCSHGSNGSQAQPVQPFWSYATFHTNGASEEQRKIGHNAWEIWNGPTLTNETSRCPEVGMWSGADSTRTFDLAYDSAAGAALLCAGSCFHSVAGKAGQLWTGLQLMAAQGWSAGAASVPLEFQDGRYIHRDDLEGAGILRVYERRLPDGRGHIVSINA